MVGFDLGPLLEGQMRTAKLKSAYNLLIIGPRSFGALSLRWIQFASVFRCARSSFIYFTNIRHFRFIILYFKYLQTLILCVTTFYKKAFYYNVFRRRLKSCNIKMFKVSYILHYECVFFPKFNKLSNFFPVVWFVTIL